MINLSEITKQFKPREEVMTVEEYFKRAAKDKSYYSTVYERLLEAIGEPEIIETAKTPRLSRIFANRKIKIYKPFKDFYGQEDIIESIVSYLQHAAQGLEERKQILYLLGPVGGGKSSLAERLKALLSEIPFFAIKGSPLNESPLGLLRLLPEQKTGIPEQYIPACISPWLTKRLDEAKGDLSKIKVVKLYPNQQRQLAVAKTEPGDENNQDISTLVGKLDIRKLEHFAQDDPDAYRYNGGLCLGNRGILEFVEMFKAPLKVLNPLLTATQEGNYKGTEALAALPFDGMILSHSNESEWQAFKENKQNEAFLDRICIVKVPYNLCYEEEAKIYSKYIANSSLQKAPTAPHTFDILSKFAVLTRLEVVKDDDLVVKMKVYNGDNVKEQYPKSLSRLEYKSLASLSEGFSGMSTRAAFKILSKTYNHDIDEVAANPVHLLYNLQEFIMKEDMSEDKREFWLTFVTEYLIPEFMTKLRKDIQVAFLDSYADYGQHLFERYIAHANAWCDDQDFLDPDTGQIYDRNALNGFLEEIEKSAKVANPKDFRHEVVMANLRYEAKNNGKSIPWTSNEKIKEVLEQKLFNNIEDILPQIAFEKHGNSEEYEKHQNFVKRMVAKGYTEKQVRLVVNFYQRQTKSK